MKALLWCVVLTGFWGLNAGASETPIIKDRWAQCKIESDSLELGSVKLDGAVERDYLDSPDELEMVQKKLQLFNLSRSWIYPRGWTYEVFSFGVELDYKPISNSGIYRTYRSKITAYMLVAKSKNLLGADQARARLCVPVVTKMYNRDGVESGISFTFDSCKDFNHDAHAGYAGWSRWHNLNLTGQMVDGEIFLKETIRLQGVLESDFSGALVCEAVSEIH